MSKADNWMPLYLGDYLADTMHLNCAEHGAYLLLLMYYWRNGPLSADDKWLMSVAKSGPRRWTDIGPIVRSFFTLESDGKLHQKRMDKERLRWSEIIEKRREAGRLGAIASHGIPPDKGGGKQVANARQVPDGCQDFATTPLPVPKERKKDSYLEGGRDARDRPEPGPDAVGARATAEVITPLHRSLKIRAYPQGQRPVMDAQDQINAISAPPRPEPKYATPEQLAILRRRRA